MNDCIIKLGLITEHNGVDLTPSRKSKRPLLGRVIMAFTMSSSQQTDVSVVFLDKAGNPAQVDGVPEWMVDNPNVLAINPGIDGLSCRVAAVGPLGLAKVTLTADADLGEGVTAVVGFLDIEITAGQAATVQLNPTAPVEKP